MTRLNVVPTPATRAIARDMLATARKESGADAVLAHLRDLRTEQLGALIGLLIGQTLDAMEEAKAATLAAANAGGLPTRGQTHCLSCRGELDHNPRRGLCEPCYDRYRHLGTLDRWPTIPHVSDQTCEEEDCTRPVRAAGKCMPHYKRRYNKQWRAERGNVVTLAARDDEPDLVDDSTVARVLSGDWRLPCNRAERLAVADRWHGSIKDLERLTGWNVARDRRLATTTSPSKKENAPAWTG